MQASDNSNSETVRGCSVHFGAAPVSKNGGIEMKKHILRGQIYKADLRPAVGSEQDGIRPVLIVQNNMGNRYSPTVIVAAITSRRTKARIPTHVLVGDVPGLFPDSTIMLEQLRTLDKSRLLEYIGTADRETMRQVDEAFSVSVGHD